MQNKTLYLPKNRTELCNILWDLVTANEYLWELHEFAFFVFIQMLIVESRRQYSMWMIVTCNISSQISDL